MAFWLCLDICVVSFLDSLFFLSRWWIACCFLYTCWLVCCLSVSLVSGWLLWWMTCLFVGHWLFSYGCGCLSVSLVSGWLTCLVDGLLVWWKAT